MHTVYTFSFLRAQDIPELYETFLQAFADYIVPIKVTREEFAMKFKREGVEPTFCVGAYHGQKLVGFILTGLGEWLGKPTAYNGGTGVLPAHRGHQLTQRMYEFMIPKLKASGVEQCLLEVIQENPPAIKAYRRAGFQITRTLDCFRCPMQELKPISVATVPVTVKEALRPNWQVYAEFCDFSPSWQNTTRAFRQITDRKKVLEAYLEGGLLVGYIAWLPRTGAIIQLGVQQGYRYKGVATHLLKEVVKHTEAPALMVINVDTACPSMPAFLRQFGFKRLLVQYEMLLRL